MGKQTEKGNRLPRAASFPGTGPAEALSAPFRRPGPVPRMALAALFCAVLAGCPDAPLPERFRPVPPEIPPQWAAVLPEPRWHLVWMGKNGRLESADMDSSGPAPEIALDHDRAAMVLAWPFWPEAGLEAGVMRPAGALFPWDAENGTLRLTWEAGPAAFFYFHMASYSAGTESTESGKPIPAKNRAWNFDWPRFRALLSGEDIPETVRADPWLADWPAIARKTIESGFDRRRIKVPAGRTTLSVTLPADGPWAGTSPFQPLHTGTAGETASLECGVEGGTLVCSTGTIRYGNGVWIWRPRLR